MQIAIKKITLTLIACMLFATGNYAQNRQIKSIVKKYRSSMSPYRYESYATKKIIYGQKEKTEVMEFKIFSNDEYQLTFCKTDFSQSIEINIYDRNPKERGKKLLYFDESEKQSSRVFSFRPGKSGSYYIEFKIPASTTSAQEEGYIILLVGTRANQSLVANK